MEILKERIVIDDNIKYLEHEGIVTITMLGNKFNYSIDDGFQVLKEIYERNFENLIGVFCISYLSNENQIKSKLKCEGDLEEFVSTNEQNILEISLIAIIKKYNNFNIDNFRELLFNAESQSNTKTLYSLQQLEQSVQRLSIGSPVQNFDEIQTYNPQPQKTQLPQEMERDNDENQTVFRKKRKTRVIEQSESENDMNSDKDDDNNKNNNIQEEQKYNQQSHERFQDYQREALPMIIEETKPSLPILVSQTLDKPKPNSLESFFQRNNTKLNNKENKNSQFVAASKFKKDSEKEIDIEPQINNFFQKENSFSSQKQDAPPSNNDENQSKPINSFDMIAMKKKKQQEQIIRQNKQENLQQPEQNFVPTIAPIRSAPLCSFSGSLEDPSPKEQLQMDCESINQQIESKEKLPIQTETVLPVQKMEIQNDKSSQTAKPNPMVKTKSLEQPSNQSKNKSQVPAPPENNWKITDMFKQK